MRLRALVIASLLVFTLISYVFESTVWAKPVHRPIVSWVIWQKTLKVHECEQKNWYAVGPTYSGGLGWHNDLWLRFKAPWMPSNMGHAKPLWQAWAMAHFVSQMNGGYWPDQFGCSGGY